MSYSLLIIAEKGGIDAVLRYIDDSGEQWNKVVAKVCCSLLSKIADELEHLLDDDNNMAEMYLTQKLNGRLLEKASFKEGYNYEFEENDQSDESYSKKFDKYHYHKLDVEELEMLLEAYFAQTNGILQRLSSGRGELQLGILIENMRREGFELSVSPPKVMYKTKNGRKLEPVEEVTIEGPGWV
ncbi:magnesium transporter MRS2-F isoform X2 [Cajanus cajan]|uniref:magnesium transporter MRS2-F isoform X2 n=1 Tax=Cajanus cajan TaxID=3821 RepID=UPI00098D8F02|nr:magnesium transporter MRS2-F isoform X2 [Cajanus cajan]